MYDPKSQPLRIFISYSWTSEDHKAWVLKLAERLDAYHEFSVTLDRWTLRTGHDLNAFMEQIATDNDRIDKVIIVSEKGYVEKANSRQRGVGREVQIISEEVFNNIEQTKFLPIVCQWETKVKPYLPVFLQSRLFIDFTDEDKFEERFSELLGELTDTPKHVRPPKSKRLSINQESESVTLSRTSQLLSEIDLVMTAHPRQLPTMVISFLEAFQKELNQFGYVLISTDALGQQVVDQITAYKPLRDCYLLFFTKIIQNGQSIEMDQLIRFFEQLYDFTRPSPLTPAVNELQFEQYKFIVYELFLSTMGLFLKNEQYPYVVDLLYSPYYLSTDTHRINPEPYRLFFQPINSINNYYRSVKGRNVSFADLLLERVSELVPLDSLVEADLLCFHISEINSIYNVASTRSGRWIPVTSHLRNRVSLPVFRHITSKRYFAKVKEIYDVSDERGLINKIQDYRRGLNGRSLGSTEQGIIYPIYDLVEVETIGRDR